MNRTDVTTAISQYEQTHSQASASIRAQKCTSILFCMTLCYHPILTAWNGIIRSILGNTYKLDTFLFYLVYGIVALFALPQILRSIRAKHILLLIGFFAVYFLSMLVPWGDFSVQTTVLSNIILYCLPAFFIALSVHDYLLLKKHLRIFAYVSLLCMLFSTFVLDNYAENGTYSQQYGYEVLPIFLILATSFFERNGWKAKLLDALCLIVSFSMILLSGARGPAACAMITFLFILVFKIASLKAKGIPLILLALAAMIFIFIFYYDILQWMLGLAQSLGFSTRSITRLLDGVFLQDSVRNEITSYALDYAQNHLFLGSGITNDRVLIAGAVSRATETIGLYPHNFFTELMMQFGGLWGACLGLGFLYLLAKRLFKKGEPGYRSVLLILLGAGFIPLLVSSSYVDSELFYCLLGLLIVGGAPKLRKEARL